VAERERRREYMRGPTVSAREPDAPDAPAHSSTASCSSSLPGTAQVRGQGARVQHVVRAARGSAARYT
jgi:hypothetical protein